MDINKYRSTKFANLESCVEAARADPTVKQSGGAHILCSRNLYSYSPFSNCDKWASDFFERFKVGEFRYGQNKPAGE